MVTYVLIIGDTLGLSYELKYFSSKEEAIKAFDIHKPMHKSVELAEVMMENDH